MDKLTWFRDARFGMFIHWGLYALLKRGEWAGGYEQIPIPEYERLAARFRPERFEPAAWAALARRAGMRYVVFTTKHHDGFCMFDSAATDYTSARRAAGTDFVREVVAAFRAEGLRVGLYYSLGDWHLPAYSAVASGDRTAVPALQAYLKAQVRELLTGYGTIDVLWFDGTFLPPEDFGAADLIAMARGLQPDILINPRSGLPGDFETCENECRPSPPGVDWEMCTCINDLWGYAEHDYNYKTVNQLLFSLVNCACQGGNLLLNVGPKPDGSIPDLQVERLAAIGRWMATHGESIRGTERLPRPMFGGGRRTRRQGRLYLHTFYWPGSRMVVPDLDDDMLGADVGRAALKATVLTTGQTVACRWDGTRLIIDGLPDSPPDPCDTVVMLETA